MTRRLNRYLAVFCLLFSCVLIGLNWQSLVQTSVFHIANEGETVIGSEAYYALNMTRQSLINNAKKLNEELQQVLKKPLKTHSHTSRAILVYLPPKMPKYNKELKWMLLSIAWMRTTQPDLVKTDLIVFTAPGEFAYAISLGCVPNVSRTEFDDPERCIVMEHVSLKTRGGQILDEYSQYVDSILILSEFEFGDRYDVILRSDTDVFITPAFATWSLPAGTSIVTGKGGYNVDNSRKHLKWIAKTKLGLADHGITNIGSTWVGTADVLVAAARLTVAAMEWMHTQEFSKYEKTAAGVDGWPHWHWPVLLLYGGHIAINQIPTNQVFVSDSESSAALDFRSSSTVPIPAVVLHIHCWQNDMIFSKYQFQAGKYKDMDLGNYTQMISAADLSVTIAVSSDRMTLNDYATITRDPVKMKNREWIRPNSIR